MTAYRIVTGIKRYATITLNIDFGISEGLSVVLIRNFRKE